MVRFWPGGSGRHEEAFEQMAILAELPDHADPSEALQLVAEASAASLPKDDKLGKRYLEKPSQHFGIKQARAGTIDRIEVMLVWTDPNVQASSTGGVSATSGSTSGNTFAFATLPKAVPWATMWNRPRSVPHDPSNQPTSENPAFDDRFLWAGDDAAATLPAAVMDALIAADRRLFAWNAFFENHFCAHTTDSPDSDDEQGDALTRFVATVAAAYD